MKKGGVLGLACVLCFVRSVLGIPTDFEKVWLKDMTSSLQKDERSLSDLDLPDDLTFQLSHGSHILTLNLRRNHGIDPNAAVYIVSKLKNGKSRLEKAKHLETEDVAYYQDRENGAFMTVRCVRRSNGQCDRVIYSRMQNYWNSVTEASAEGQSIIGVSFEKLMVKKENRFCSLDVCKLFELFKPEHNFGSLGCHTFSIVMSDSYVNGFGLRANNTTHEIVPYRKEELESKKQLVFLCLEKDDHPHMTQNGNVRIGDSNYDLRPSESDVTSRSLVDVPHLLGKQYVLRNQATIKRHGLVKSKDAASINERNLEENFKNLFRLFPQEQNKRNHFPHNNYMLSSSKGTGLRYRDKKDNVKQVYSVEIAVLIDSSIWSWISSMVQSNFAQEEDVSALKYIREIYSQIINGVDLLYNGIEDNSIKISVTLAEFYIFKTIFDFPHKNSMLKKKEGLNYMDAQRYVDDVGDWDSAYGSQHAKYDHAMLFTRFDLYEHYIGNNEIVGISRQSSICDIGKRVSIIQVEDFFWSVDTATHELGHNLGAVHDGEGEAKDCPAEDNFIMTSYDRTFEPGEPYSRNPWLFSNCSVQSFKALLSSKACLLKEGTFFNKNEWMGYVQKEPGERYTKDVQCALSNGPSSRFCGVNNADVCLFMKCTDPNTGQCLARPITAARGTQCGDLRWCIEGNCVSKV